MDNISICNSNFSVALEEQKLMSFAMLATINYLHTYQTNIKLVNANKYKIEKNQYNSFFH